MKTKQLIASLGINEKRALANMKRRAAYRRNLDRPKIFAGTTNFSGNTVPYGDGVRTFEILKTTTSTAAYVFAWCRLNHLKISN